MPRARILLCPQFTEVEWAIAPLLSEWAEVATFDVPGVGDEPISGDGPERFTRELVVQRALQEIDSMGWDSYFVAGDGWGTATAVRVAVARPEQVLGLALSHASLNYETEGDRPAVNGELVAAMTQLLRTNYDSFVRYGIVQFTQGQSAQGGFDEDLVDRMVARFPPMEVAAPVWEMHVGRPEPIGELLGELSKPLLLAEHHGCLPFTAEGYEDAVAAFPTAHTASIQKPPTASDEFAGALRDFCEDVLSER
jgi:pimeloyl-ACP methyl ester carboxylesterase